MSRTRVRRRRATAVLLLTLALAPVAGRAVASLGAPGPSDPPATHVVRDGDTLWSIARRSVGPEGDPRPLVDAIRRLNDVDPGSLVPGTTLRVPAA